jgi:hypothetical protein
MTTPFEVNIGEMFQSAVGDPLLAGILILAFFGIIAFVYPSRLDGKIVILFPAIMLAMLFIPFLYIFLVLGLGMLVFVGYQRLTQR